MPRELTEAEWKVSFGSDSIPDYARAAISAADAYGWMDEQTQRTIAAFQRAASVDVTGLYDYDTAVRAAAFGKTVAPRAFTFGAEVDIASLQAKLNALGYQPALAVDGAIGDKTRAGVRWFQAAHSLSATGVLDNATVMALDLPKGPTPKKPIAQVSGPPVSGLRQVVVNSFLGFSTPFEGYTPYLYTDSKGFVTTGMGNLVENLTSHTPIEGVFSLVWKKPDGSAASRAEIAAAWQTVKSAWPGVQSMASQRLTNLRLPQEEIAKLIAGQLSQNQTVLQKKFPGFSSWPADAQLAFHSLSWAWGPGFIDTWRNKNQRSACRAVRERGQRLSPRFPPRGGHHDAGLEPRGVDQQGHRSA